MIVANDAVGLAVKEQAVHYTATITTAPLRLRESRIIADLLLRNPSPAQWHDALFEQNILQMRSPESIRRISNLLRKRLEPMGAELWQMVRDAAREQANQAVMAGAVKHSRLLGDFMDIAIREQRKLFANQLETRVWSDYIASCRGRDPDMPHWSDETLAKLRSVVFSMLAEVGYLSDTKTLRLQPVFIVPPLAQILKDRRETYVPRCLEVME